MKKFILLVLFPSLLLAQEAQMIDLVDKEAAQANKIAAASIGAEVWLENYDEALADAKKENRNVLVYFTGSDWCPPCKMLKKDLFDTDEFKTVASNYTLLYIDIPRNRNLLSPEQMKHNTELVAKMNRKGVFPLIVILNEKGAELDKYSGYSMTGEIQYHLDLLEKHKG